MRHRIRVVSRKEPFAPCGVEGFLLHPIACGEVANLPAIERKFVGGALT